MRTALAGMAGREVSAQEFAYLMYPKVLLDYLQQRPQFGKVSVLPTSVCFHGMQPDDAISVDVQRGKTLSVRFIAVSDSQQTGRAQCSSSSMVSHVRSKSVTAATQCSNRHVARRVQRMPRRWVLTCLELSPQ
jgi:pyruvate carboxylase